MSDSNENENNSIIMSIGRKNGFIESPLTSSEQNNSLQEEKLSLRKKKIFDSLLSKRKAQFSSNKSNINNNTIINTSNNNSSKKEIDISSLQCSEEIKSNIEKYLKEKYIVKSWFKYLFSKNINNIKVSLFLIRKFTSLQIQEIPDINRRTLSRNNTELINGLCSYLLHEDKQIAYESCWCLTNITWFPQPIENRIYLESNFEILFKFFIRLINDIQYFQHESLSLIINIAANEKICDYFIKNRFDKYLFGFLNNVTDMNLSNEVNCCIRILINFLDYEKKTGYKNIEIFIPFITLIKKIFINYYLSNPWMGENMYKFPVCLLCQFSAIKINFDTNLKIISELINNGNTNNNLIKVLINLYSNTSLLKEWKNNILIIFFNLSSISQEIDETIINLGILDLLSNELNLLVNINNINKLLENNESLNLMLEICINFLKSEKNVSSFFISGIIYRIIEIGNVFMGNLVNKEVNESIKKCFQIINDIAIRGFSYDMMTNMIKYRNGLVVKLLGEYLKYTFENNFLKDNKEHLIDSVVFILKELLIASENMGESDEKIFKELVIKNSLEDLLNNLLNNCKEYNLYEITPNAIEDILKSIN